jgi:hypothetical protein
MTTVIEDGLFYGDIVCCYKIAIALFAIGETHAVKT